MYSVAEPRGAMRYEAGKPTMAAEKPTVETDGEIEINKRKASESKRHESGKPKSGDTNRPGAERGR